MKQNRVYRNVIVGVTSLAIGIALFTSKAYAEESSVDNSQSPDEEKNSNETNISKVNKVVVEQNSSKKYDSTDQDNTSETNNSNSTTHKDTIWEPAPPLAKPQETESHNGNVSSDGVVRPHAQSISKKQNKKSKKEKVKRTKAYTVNNTSAKKSYAVKTQILPSVKNTTKKQTIDSDANRQKSVAATVKSTNSDTLPQTGAKDNTELIFTGVVSISLSMIGLAGVKSRNNQA